MIETTKDRLDLIRKALQIFHAKELVVEDESYLHVGHAGAQSGGGHYVVHIISETFNGKTAVQRHQMIYEALGDLMVHDIHAISITAKTPDE